jgi:hypothetical protein
LNFGQGNASRDFSAGLNQISDRYNSERQKIQNDRERAVLVAGEAGLTNAQKDEFNRRLALQDDFESRSIESYQAWYVKRAKDEQNAGLGAQEAVKNYLDEIGKTGKGFDAKKLVNQIIAEFLRLQVIRPIMQQALGGNGNWLQGLLGTAASFLSGSYNANYGNEGRNYPQAADGTNYVARSGLAVIHQGEAVIPKAYNPAAGGSGGDGGINITNHYTIGAGVNRAEMVQAVAAGNDQLRGDIMRQRSRGTGGWR